MVRLGQILLGLLFFHTLPWGSPTTGAVPPHPAAPQVPEHLEASAWAAVQWAVRVPVLREVLQPGRQVLSCYLGGG